MEPDRQTDQSPDPRRRKLLVWLWRLPVVAALAGAGYGLYEGGKVLLGKEAVGEEPQFEPIEASVVAPLSAFDAQWRAIDFFAGNVPAVALRLPEPVPGALSTDGVHIAAFSRVCTHQGCTVSFNPDAEAIAFAYNYRSESPALVCPCHLSVFRPDQGGRAVSGPARTPLPRVRLELVEGEIVATGVEATV